MDTTTSPTPTRQARSEKRKRPEMVGFRLDRDERERLTQAARQDDVSVAEVVRRAVLRYLDPTEPAA